jgi:hypothetical protein
MNTISLPMLRLIDALAEKAVADYLRPEAPPAKAEGSERTNPVPLPAMDKAA